MPSPRRRGASRALPRGRCLAFIGGLLAAAPAQAGEPDLQALLSGLALDAGRQEIAFEESRFNRLVTEPIRSEGRLIYEPPDRLIKRIDAPRRESAVLERERLAILDAQNREVASIDLWLQPDLQMVYGSIKALLTGDAEALRAAFWISLDEGALSGASDAWALTLRPKSDSARTRLAQVLVEGRGPRILSFEFLEADGDRSRLRLLPEQPRE